MHHLYKFISFTICHKQRILLDSKCHLTKHSARKRKQFSLHLSLDILLIKLYFINVISLHYFFWSICAFDTFWFNFCMWCEVRVQPHSFACDYPIVLASFVEETIFSPCDLLGTLIENQLPVNVRLYFLLSSILFHWFLAILLLITHYGFNVGFPKD